MYRIFILIICFTLSTTAIAEEPADFPQDLLYNGKPIDAWCINSSANSSFPVNLNDCYIQKDKIKVEKIDYNNELQNQGYNGYIGYAVGPASLISAYQFYKVISTISGAHIVHIFFYDGLGEYFSNLAVVKRLNENTISSKGLASGDHCSKSANPNITVDGNKIYFSVNVTPSDIFQLANQPMEYLEYSGDYANCYATAEYEIDVANIQSGSDQNNAPPTFIRVDLGTRNPIPIIKTPKNAEREESIKLMLTLSGDKSYQCFDKVANHFIQNGMRYLNATQLNDYVNAIKTECLKSKN